MEERKGEGKGRGKGKGEIELLMCAVQCRGETLT